MKKLTKITSIVVAMSLLLSSLGACAKKDDKTQETQTAATSISSEKTTLEPYDLKVLTAGDLPADNDLVCQEISKVSKDELNINLSIDYTPWSDYIEKTKLRASAGEQFDIFLSFMGELPGMIGRKQAVELDGLLDQYGSDLKKVIAPSDWTDVTVDGKIYGVPSVYVSVFMQTLGIRKDLREKYNLPPLNTLSDIENYFDTIMKNEKGIMPFAATIYSPILRAVSYGSNIPEAHYFNWGDQTWGKWVQIDSSKKPYKVENYFKSDACKALVQWTSKAYKNGWIDKDINVRKPGVDQDLFKSGKAAAVYADMYNLASICPVIEKNVPGAQVELVMPYADKKTFKTQPTCNNFALVSSTSEKPERAVMFLNWLRKDRANYELYMYGIKGKHWNPVGDDKAELVGVTDPSKRPYNPTPWWTEQMNWDRVLTTDPQPYADAIKLFSNKEYEVSSLANFVVNTSNFKTEMAQISTVVNEKMMPILRGTISEPGAFDAAVAAIDKAGMDKVIADIQKQVDAYSAKTGK